MRLQACIDTRANTHHSCRLWLCAHLHMLYHCPQLNLCAEKPVLLLTHACPGPVLQDAICCAPAQQAQGAGQARLDGRLTSTLHGRCWGGLS